MSDFDRLRHQPVNAADVRRVARRAASRARATTAAAAPHGVHVASLGEGPRAADAAGRRVDRAVVAAQNLIGVPDGGTYVVEPGARITPLAEEEAHRRGIRFTAGRAAQPGARRVVVASDHGGYDLKCDVLAMLREQGCVPVDLGPDSKASVDYPDFARAVAEEVGAGRADLGVVVDGAGIGSAMVANKVPGVLAANCWDERTAKNAREHNHANVLTLGSGHLDPAGAFAVVAAFLATPVGADRHERRMRKTRDVEARWLRGAPDANAFDPTR